MNTSHGRSLDDDVAEQQHANDLIKLIRKLRSMNMDDEAEQVQRQLASCRVAPTDNVLAAPPDTD